MDWWRHLRLVEPLEADFDCPRREDGNNFTTIRDMDKNVHKTRTAKKQWSIYRLLIQDFLCSATLRPKTTFCPILHEWKPSKARERCE